MMYRHNFGSASRDKNPQGGKRHFHLWFLIVLVIGIVVFVSARQAKKGSNLIDSSTTEGKLNEADRAAKGEKGDTYVFRKRLCANKVPTLELNGRTYGQIFNDSNHVQLVAARRSGIDPHKLGDPAKSKELVLLRSTKWYHVDTMYHARPYLTPEATLLLQYIGVRFEQLMEEQYPEKGNYRVIVTSALRTEESEQRLRRVNRNATDTSCHMYGTTFDLSAQRYRYGNECDTVVDYCKLVLAQVLYELRYEGLCYVKYERRSCFHITMRSTQYEGTGEWEMRRYLNPGSPSLIVKETTTKPKTETKTRTKAVTKKETSTKTKTVTKTETNKKTKTETKTVTKTKTNTTDKKERINDNPNRTPQPITERERLSLEQYERRY